MRLPEGWTEVSLEELTTKISDGLHSTPKYVDKSAYFFINGNNLKDNRIVITENTKCVSEDEYLAHRKDLSSRTILLSINGTIGNLAYFSGEKVILGKSAAYINLKNDVDINYIFFSLASRKTQSYFEFELTGSTILNLSLKSIKKTKIVVPPLPQQQKIARILSTVDAVIEKTEAAIAKYKAIKAGMMHDLFTRGINENGQLRPSYQQAPHLYKPSKLGWIPKEWEVLTVENMLIDKKGAMKIGPFGSQLKKEFFTDKGFKVYGQENVFNNNFNIGNRRISPDRFYSLQSCELFPDDIVISMMGTIGKCVIVPANIEQGIMDSHLLRLQINSDLQLKELFVQLIAFSDIAKKQIKQLSVGGIMEGLSSKIIKRLNLPVPLIKEQHIIYRSLETIDKKIELEQTTLNKYQKLKQGLMQDLLTGKVKVSLTPAANE